MPPSQFVSAPLERHGSSGIDAAGLEPPTGTGVAGTDPGDLPTGWVPEQRSEQNVSGAERVGRAPTGVGSVGRARRVFGLAAHGLEGMGSLRANPLLVPSRPERRPRALGAKRPGPSASAARLPHSPGSSSQEWRAYPARRRSDVRRKRLRGAPDALSIPRGYGRGDMTLRPTARIDRRRSAQLARLTFSGRSHVRRGKARILGHDSRGIPTRS